MTDTPSQDYPHPTRPDDALHGLQPRHALNGQELLDLASWTDLDHISRGNRLAYTFSLLGVALAVAIPTFIAFFLFVPMLGALIGQSTELPLADTFEPSVWIATLILPLTILITLRIWEPKRHQEALLERRGQLHLQILSRLTPFTPSTSPITYLSDPNNAIHWALSAPLRDGGEIALRLDDLSETLTLDLVVRVPRHAHEWNLLDLANLPDDTALHTDLADDTSTLALHTTIPLSPANTSTLPLLLADLINDTLVRAGTPTADPPTLTPLPFTRSADVQPPPELDDDTPQHPLYHPANAITFPARATGETQSLVRETALRMLGWFLPLALLTYLSITLYLHLFVPVLEREVPMELALFVLTPLLCFFLFWGLRVPNRWRLLPKVRRHRVRYSRDLTPPILSLTSYTLRLSASSPGIHLHKDFSIDLSHYPASSNTPHLWLLVHLQQDGEHLRFRTPVSPNEALTQATPRALATDPILPAQPFAEWVWPTLRIKAVELGNPLAWKAG